MNVEIYLDRNSMSRDNILHSNITVNKLIIVSRSALILSGLAISGVGFPEESLSQGLEWSDMTG